ncbi:MAG: MOSC domain-containing protein [Pseudomonadota bacterium]
MPARLAAIYRHPVKSLGEEALTSVSVAAGRAMPWDRVWAVAHGRSEFNPAEPEWVESHSSVIQSTNPNLARITCAFRETTGRLSLAHPDLGEITVDPEAEGQRLTDWLAPIAAPSGPPPYRVIRVPGGQALTDFPDTHYAIGNLASLRALEDMAGRKLEHIRFRMNLWIDGAAPWEEFDWLDGEVTIGGVRFRVMDRATRCSTINADPETGTRTTDLTRVLYNRFKHMDFGVYAQAKGDGELAVGDEVAA